MSEIVHSFQLYEYDEALTPYGCLETKPPVLRDMTVDDFRPGTHFRTGAEEGTHSLILNLDERLLTLVIDESGSMTWNDNSADRYEFAKSLVNRLGQTYPGDLDFNLIGFGGIPTKTIIFIAQSTLELLEPGGESFESLAQNFFADSVFDFAGVRVVRRTDGFPSSPIDGAIVADGLIEAVKDENLVENQTYYYAVYSYNKSIHYSNAQYLQVTPRDRVLPNGLDGFSHIVRRLPGVARDDYTILILNFLERSGSRTFDSSGNQLHGTIIEADPSLSFWRGDAASVSFPTGGDQPKLPVGVRFDGSASRLDISANQDCRISAGSKLTINVWLFRYANQSERYIIGLTDPNSSSVNWCLSLTSDNRISLSTTNPSISIATSNNAIPDSVWTMVTVTIDDRAVNFYRNGQADGSGNISSFTSAGSDWDISVGDQPTRDSNSINPYFGSINQVSIHNIDRDSTYINSLYGQEAPVFEQLLQTSNQSPADNSQRDVLLSWSITDDYNYAGGQVKIVRKYNSIPSHVDDGDTVLTATPSVGTYYYVDVHASDEFINFGNYYYRAFTINSLGNPCEREEARILNVFIPPSVNDEPEPAMPSVIMATGTPGNGKIRLQWQNSNDSRIRGIKVYASQIEYPTTERNDRGEIHSTGDLLFDTPNRTEFIHRISDAETIEENQSPLENGEVHYYTIITYDQQQNISENIYLRVTPSSEATIEFPAAEIEDLHYRIINATAVSLQWENPVLKSDQLDLWFGQSALIFVNITDLFGGPLTDISNLKLTVAAKKADRQLYKEPGDGTPFEEPPEVIGLNALTSAEDEVFLTFATVQTGLLKGIVTHSLDVDTLNKREKYFFKIRATYRIVDPELARTHSRLFDRTQDLITEDEFVDDEKGLLFGFYSKTVTVTFRHPVKIKVINKLHKTVRIPPEIQEPPICADYSPVTTKATYHDGGYVGSTIPYVARVEVEYRNEPVPDGTPINVELFKAKLSSERRFKSSLDERPDYTTIIEGDYRTFTVTEEELGPNGEPTGEVVTKSVVDVEILAPEMPETVTLYASINYSGLFADTMHGVLWVSRLFFSIDANKPPPDNVTIAEQFAYAFYRDPDDPENEEKFTPVADGTVIKWELEPGEFSKERPFYSMEHIPYMFGGTYSITQSGIARNVFFGPVGNLESHWIDECCLAEEYIIKASIVVDGLDAKDKDRIGYSCEEEDAFTTKRLLMSIPDDTEEGAFPHYLGWADGIDIIKCQIARDPSISDMFYAECFRDCVLAMDNGQLIEMPLQQIIKIDAGPVEILWNCVFDVDPYTGAQTLISCDSVKPEIIEGHLVGHLANVPLTDDTTDIYFRINRFVGDKNPQQAACEAGSTGDCIWTNYCRDTASCVPKTGNTWINVHTVIGTTTMVLANKEVRLFGGGAYEDGIPPIYTGFREPLALEILEVRANGQRIQELIVDGVSTHEVVVEVTFRDEPAPDGTKVNLRVEGNESAPVQISATNIFTRLTNDTFINPEGSKRSLAYFTIEPLSNVYFDAKIIISTSYDELGTTERLMEACLIVQNIIGDTTTPWEDPEEPPEPDDPVKTLVCSDEMLIYDTSTNSYIESTAMSIGRAGHFSAGVSLSTVDQVYVFGGYNGAALVPTSEVYNPTSEEWEFVADIITPRMFGQTAVHNNIIYCIGGIELDPLLSQYRISRKVEAYDTVNEIWLENLAPMPEGYAIAFGIATAVGGSIYVMAGCNSVKDNSEPDDTNEDILRYNISADSWTVISPPDINLYKRLWPMFYAVDNLIYVYSGSFPKSDAEVSTERYQAVRECENEVEALLLNSPYYQALPIEEQLKYRAEKLAACQDIEISPYVYLSTGFIYNTVTSNMSDKLDDEWTTLPIARDRASSTSLGDSAGQMAYFIGGSNLDLSTTLSKNDRIDVTAKTHTANRRLPRGRSSHAAVGLADRIYITGGITSGHTEGWLEIRTNLTDDIVEAMGRQSSGLGIELYTDDGELATDTVNILVQASLHIDELDNAVANRMIRAGDEGRVNIRNPNSSTYQFGVAKRLSEQIYLFPVLLSRTEFTTENGSGFTRLFPRSEDTLDDLQKMAEFVTRQIGDSPINEEVAQQLSAIGDALTAIKMPPTIIYAGQSRDLYNIELQITVLDDYYYGSTVNNLDQEVFDRITEKREEEREGGEEPYVPPTGPGGNVTRDSECLTLSGPGGESNINDPGEEQAGSDPGLPGGGGGQSGQNRSSRSLVPLKAQSRRQQNSPTVLFFNRNEWLPQVKNHLDSNNSTANETMDVLEILDSEVPFGGSQLYDALAETAHINAAESAGVRKKNIYVLSDNSQNTSSLSRDDAIDEINSIDGEGQVPVMYVVFSTSFPTSLAGLLSRSEIGDVEKIVTATNGQSATILQSNFVPDVLSLMLSGATGALGYGNYKRIIDFGQIAAITRLSNLFELPANTAGQLRFRYSDDGYNFGDYTEFYIGTDAISFSGLFARQVEFDVVLQTSFLAEDEYLTAAGVPKLISIGIEYSLPREDYIYLNDETPNGSPQQVAAVFEGDLPSFASAKIGTATSVSHDWRDFATDARPEIDEFGKSFLLERRSEETTSVPDELLTTKDGVVFESVYGPFDPTISITIWETDEEGNTTEVTEDYQIYPRTGQVIFSSPKPQDKIYTASIIDQNRLRVGYKLINRLHLESICVRGTGYMYSTNRILPAPIAQVRPRALNLKITPEHPKLSDTITASYDYSDPNYDSESGTIINWFKNNVQLFEIDNKPSFTNTDLLPNNKLAPQDKLHVMVTPSDGRDYGALVVSPSVTIASSPPSAENLRLTSTKEGVQNDRYDTSSLITAEYEYTTIDTGDLSKEEETIITWFVNSVIFKINTYSESDDDATKLIARSLVPMGEDPYTPDAAAYVINNQIYVEVLPRSVAQLTGETVTSQTIIMENTIPEVFAVEVIPANPTRDSILEARHVLDDDDITVTQTQTDQSETRWYQDKRAKDGFPAVFEEVAELFNQRRVASMYLQAGDQWYAEIRPYDGLEYGVRKSSNIVTIGA